MNNELWKSIPGYEGVYEVSNLGRVRNFKRGNILKTQINNSGYELVHMNNDGKRKANTVHRLVALSFLPNSDNLPFVNHCDSNKLNNNLSNLEWCTQSQNTKHMFLSGNGENVREKARDRMRLLGEKHWKTNVVHFIAASMKRAKRVLQLSINGEVLNEYLSLRAAAKETKLSRTNISRVLKGKSLQTGGFLWKLKV